MNTPKITVAIVADHPIVRAGVRTILASAPDMTVVADGANGRDALCIVPEYHPDVLVLDVNLPDLNAVEVIRQLQQQQMETSVIILSVYDESQTIFGLLDAGARGYILKEDALEALLSAVRAAARGESWLSPKIAHQVIRRSVGMVNSSSKPCHTLTPRESEILRLLAQGLHNDAIALHLTLTKRTVQNHVSTIYSKLGVSSRTEALLYAIHNKLVELSSLGDPVTRRWS